jgi:serine/threonine protein kinase
MTNQNKQLPPNTILENFRIVRTLGGGGFSIVYLAEELETGDQYVIKEYMPGRLAGRAGDHSVNPLDDNAVLSFQKGRMMFFQEASTLATLKHDNIVNVRSFFRANNTVYMALYYDKGVDLQHYITKRNERLSEKFLMTVFPPLIDALKMIHDRGYLHLDIKPGNIQIRQGGVPLLLDFGAIHQRQLSRHDQVGHVTSHGYSPIEQYNRNGYMGPWTDIYALGATLYTCISGKPPPPANQRYENDTIKPAAKAFRKQYSKNLLQAVDWALEVNPELRPQSLDELSQSLLTELEESPSFKEKLWKRINPK